MNHTINNERMHRKREQRQPENRNVHRTVTNAQTKIITASERCP